MNYSITQDMHRERRNDELGFEENEAFTAWARSLPEKSWVRYDLSACRLGWEACASNIPGKLDVVQLELVDAIEERDHLRRLLAAHRAAVPPKYSYGADGKNVMLTNPEDDPGYWTDKIITRRAVVSDADTVDRVAKAIADAAGHGMREKCEHLAHAAISAYRLATWPETKDARHAAVATDLKALADEIEACWICASIGDGEITLETINRWHGRMAAMLAAAPEATLRSDTYKWPVFELVQKWALENGYSGALDDEAYRAYKDAHPDGVNAAEQADKLARAIDDAMLKGSGNV